jgi:hypothetical protein
MYTNWVWNGLSGGPGLRGVVAQALAALVRPEVVRDLR